MFFTPASGGTLSEVQKVAGAKSTRLAVFVGSLAAGSAQVFLQCGPFSGGPFADVVRPDGTGLVFTVCSGAPSVGVTPAIAMPYVRLRFSLALTDATSVKVDPLGY